MLEQAKEFNRKYKSLLNTTKIVVDKMIAAGDLTDEEKTAFVELFDLFEPEKAYKTGNRFLYDGKVYEVITGHTSQIDWLPNELPALYKVYLQKETSGGDEVINEFVQPIGSHDAYSKGDKVSFDGFVYESLMDNNVYSPSAYPQGWKQIL